MAFWFLLASSGAAQTAQFEGKRIEDIQYSPAQILDPADLARTQRVEQDRVFVGYLARAAVSGAELGDEQPQLDRRQGSGACRMTRSTKSSNDTQIACNTCGCCILS